MSTVVRPASLVPLDEHRAVRVYQRNLPHWRQDGCTYFVTFRLADSIPAGIRRGWELEKQEWLERLGIAYDGERGRWRDALNLLRPDERFRFELHFNRQVQGCLDRGLGECLLGRADCAAAIRTELLRDDGRRHHLGDFAIMPNHVHLLITPVADVQLELILKSIKAATAVACNRLRNRTGTLWQAESHDHIVRSLVQLSAYREYVASNPARANLVVPSDALYRAEWMDAWFQMADVTE